MSTIPLPLGLRTGTSRGSRTSGATSSSSRPARRDPFIDVVRAVGTIGVVLAHWLAPAAAWDGRTLEVGNAFGHGVAWMLTWPLQLLALLFFAAGAAAAGARPSPAPWWTRMRGRVRHLLPPVAALLGFWVAASIALPALGVPGDLVRAGAAIAPQLLWFLGVHLALVTLAPWLLTQYRRRPVPTLAWVLAIPLSLDALSTAGGLPVVGWGNVLAGWAVPFVLGLAWAEHRRGGGEVARSVLVIALLVATGVTVGSVAAGVFPASMVGLPGAEVSNLAPPTTAAIGLGLMQVAVVLLLRRRLLHLAARPRPRRAVAWLAAHALPIYLWHVTAALLVTGAVLTTTGDGLADPWSVHWWLGLPGWLLACSGVLAVLLTRRPWAWARRRSVTVVPRAHIAGPGQRGQDLPASTRHAIT